MTTILHHFCPVEKSDTPTSHRIAFVLAVELTVKSFLSLKTGIGFAAAEMCSSLGIWFIVLYQGQQRSKWERSSLTREQVRWRYSKFDKVFASVQGKYDVASDITKMVYWTIILLTSVTIYFAFTNKT